ncbi:MAG: MraY family glycosyltransferase [Candidatus Sumerlaeota bacterium]|nr:MraY family glycosyltransferase [Candidatus Sumerlaeota bacterium]
MTLNEMPIFEVWGAFAHSLFHSPWRLFMLMYCALGYLLALVLVRCSIIVAHRWEVLARPSERGSHDYPTPRLGGAGIATAFYFILLFSTDVLADRYDLPPAPWLAAVVIGGAYAFVGGLLDDILELNPRWKFLFQFAAAGTAVMAGFTHNIFTLPLGGAFAGEAGTVIMPHWMGGVFTFVFIIFMMNAYNFMDGMDGQAATFGAITCFSLTLFIAAGGFAAGIGELLSLASLCGALLALLYFNHAGKSPDSKTFMGDGGSQFVGYLLAVYCLHLETATRGVFTFITALILISPFLWDVCFTLARRIMRGENILEAHRSHLYQRLLIAGWSHGRVMRLNIVLWVACALLAQLYSVAGQLNRHWVQIAALTGCLILLILYTLYVHAVERARRRETHQETMAPITST